MDEIRVQKRSFLLFIAEGFSFDATLHDSNQTKPNRSIFFLSKRWRQLKYEDFSFFSSLAQGNFHSRDHFLSNKDFNLFSQKKNYTFIKIYDCAHYKTTIFNIEKKITIRLKREKRSDSNNNQKNRIILIIKLFIGLVFHL